MLQRWRRLVSVFYGGSKVRRETWFNQGGSSIRQRVQLQCGGSILWILLERWTLLQKGDSSNWVMFLSGPGGPWFRDTGRSRDLCSHDPKTKFLCYRQRRMLFLFEPQILILSDGRFKWGWVTRSPSFSGRVLFTDAAGRQRSGATWPLAWRWDKVNEVSH